MRDERLEGVWHLQAPEKMEIPLVLDSPHSGTEFPTDFRPVAPMADVRKPEDSYIHDIHAAAPEHGAVLLSALFPRIYLDPNRSTRDLDPDLIDGEWTEPLSPSVKSKNGIGLIWTKTPSDFELYDRRLTVNEITNRIENYHKPYQGKLKEELDRVYSAYGSVWHINCHSMPQVTTWRCPEAQDGLIRPDFIIGTRDGTTAAADFTEVIRETIAAFGYDVRVNEHFKGVELIRAFSDTAMNRHSLQIEINRALYMDEETGWRSENYETVKGHMTELVKHVGEFVRSKLAR